MTPTLTTVLSTHELLESILLHVDLRTLLTSAQRVNQTWHDLIRNSLPLQRALFFVPDDNHRDGERTYNPLLTDAFPTFLPLSRPTEGKGKTLDLTSLEMVRRPDKQAAYLRANASWRRMLVRQPPVRSMLAARVALGMGFQDEKTEQLPLPDTGLLMGRLFELVISPMETFFVRNRYNELFWDLRLETVARQWRGVKWSRRLRRAMAQADAVLYSFRTVSCVMRDEDDTAEEILQAELARGYGIEVDLD